MKFSAGKVILPLLILGTLALCGFLLWVMTHGEIM